MLVNPDKLTKSASLMPSVSKLWLLNKNMYIVEFKIEGYFSTYVGIKYLGDAVARFRQTFGVDAVKPTLMPVAMPDYDNQIIIHLKEFTLNLKSLKSKIANKTPLQKTYMDEVFWSIKLWMERELNQNRIPTVNELTSVGLTYAPNKELSTIRAKSRSIHSWYSVRGFKPTKDSRRRYKGNEKMTRKEAAEVATKVRTDRVKVRINQAINIMVMQDEKITIKKLAEYAQVGYCTSQKYLKQIRNKEAG